MLNLSELVFKVNTEALVDAANKVAALGKSVDGLSSTFSKLEKSSSQASKAQAKAEKDLAAAEVDRAKAADIAAKTEERKAKAVRETVKATEEATAATKSSVSILERQQTILEFQANGYSKGQASILAYAKAAGVAATEIQEIGKVLQAQRTLMGGDPFDKSLGSLKSLQNEFKTLKEVQRLYTAEIPLTRKQMEGLALDKLRLIEAMKSQGKTMGQIKAALKNLNIEYIATAGNINRVTKAENELDKARKDSANANAFLEKEMQRVNFALQAQNSELNKGTANALNRFEQNLKRSGLTLDQQRVKMEEYRKGLLALEKTKGGNTDYITRALGPQITDIFVGLATGQSPLTVMLQQGGQLRDQFALAGVAADDMGAKMRTAAKDMVVSVAAVARAFGDLLIGAFIDAGKGVVNFVSQIALVDKVTEGAKRRLAAMGDEGFAYIGKLEKFAGVIAAGIGITLAATIAAVVALGVALKQVTTEQNELAKSLNLTGAALGMSSKEVVAFAQGLDSVKTSAAIEFINELSKAGVRTSKDIAGLTEVAIDLEKYGGVALKETAKAYDDLQKKPFEALMKVAEGTGQVSQETIDMALQMKLAGDEVGLLNLAQKEFVRANKAAVEAIKSEINPMTALWITVKDGITFAWEGLKNFARTGVVLEGVVKVLNTILTGVLAITTATRFAGKTLGGYLAIMGQVADGVNPFSGVSASDALKNIQGIFSEYKADVKNLGAETSAAYDQIWNGVKTTTGLTDKAREANSSYATDTLKGMSDLEKSYNSIEKAELKKITRQQAINKALEDYKQKNKQASDYQLKLIEQGAGLAWDKANKEKSKKDPKENYFAALMRDATNATIKADGAVQDLTKSEIKLREVQADPRFKALSKDEQDRITRIYETAAATERVTAAEDLKNKLLGKAVGLGKEYYDTLEIIENYHKRGIYSDAEVKQLTDALYKATPAYKENVKAVEELNNKLFKFREESLAIRQQLDEENRGLDLRVALLGRTEKEQVVISREYERQAKLAKVSFDLEKRKRDIEKEWAGNAVKIWELELAAEQDAADQRKAINRGVAVAYAEDIQKEFDRISGGITDSIVTALFEGGKAGSKKMRDFIMAELREPVTIVVQAVVNTLLGSVIGGLTGGSGAGGIAGGLLGNAAMSAGGSALGSAIGLGNAGSLLSGFSGTTIGAGMVGPSVAAPTLMSGLGNMASAIPGWGWAIAGIAALAGLMSKKATPHAGAGSTFSAASGLQNINLGAANNMGFMANYAKETQGLTDQIAKTLVGALDSTAKSFGTTAGYAVSAAFADDTSKDGAWGQLIIKKLGVGDIVNWGLEAAVGKWAPKEFADGAEGQQQYMNAIAKSARDALKSAIGDVRWAQNMLDALGDSPTIEQLSTTVDQINQAQTAIGELGKNIKGFANLTNEAVTTLMDASGGAQLFFANMQAFYENFFSESEKIANQSRDMAADLAAVGLVMPKTREEFRAMVEQQLALGEAGAKGAAALLKYSTIFAGIADANTQAAQDALDQQEKLLEAYKQQRKDTLNIQIDLVNEQVNSFQKLFDFLQDQIKKLYGSVESTARMQLQDARNVINQAQSTGVLPEFDVLQSAVDIITGSMGSNRYVSKVEMERDKLRFAAQLEDLSSTADKNLKQAKNTLDALKLQLESLDRLNVTSTSQLNVLYAIESSLNNLPSALGQSIFSGTGISSGSTRPTLVGSTGGVGSGPAYWGSGTVAKVAYGVDEALSSFEKFTDWYKGLYYNAQFSSDYQVPDWFRVGGKAWDGTDKEMFGTYLFYKNNPQYAADFANITQGGKSQFSTNGSTLAKTDLSTLPTEIAAYFKTNYNDLLSYEAFGLDPALAYLFNKNGPEAYGVNRQTQSITDFLRNNKWTGSGIVANNNLADWSGAHYRDYKLSRYDTSNGTIVDLDGTIYTIDGKPLGKASRSQMEAIYGRDFLATLGNTYSDSRTSTLYNQNTAAGMSEAEYYSTLRTNLDTMISSGWTAQAIADAMMQYGASLADAANAYGVTPAEIAANLTAGGATKLPAFAEGGSYSGGLALVGEKGPELINFNNGGYISTAAQTAKALDQSDVCAAIDRLSAKVEMLEANTRVTAIGTNKVAKILDRVTPDGTSLQTTVV